MDQFPEWIEKALETARFRLHPMYIADDQGRFLGVVQGTVDLGSHLPPKRRFVKAHCSVPSDEWDNPQRIEAAKLSVLNRIGEFVRESY